MFKNYLKIALRNLRRHKFFSLVNVMGLAVGMACFFLILALIQNQFSYERFHEKRDQIYRLMRVEKIEGRTETSDRVPAPLAPELKNEFPGISHTVRATRTGFVAVNYGERSFVERSVFLADPSFFKVFTFPLVKGDPETALEDKYSVVLTEDSAKKYFGDEDPIGKTLNYDNRIDLKVTAVARNLPRNTDFKFDLLVSFELINRVMGWPCLESWGAFNWETYVLVRKDFAVSEFPNRSIEFCRKFRTDDTPDFQLLHSLFLRPITETHLPPRAMVFIYVLSGIAVVILLLACINFMNLAVAQSAARAREVGMRKVIGANRFQLIGQFLGESVFLVFIALPLALCLVELLIPVYIRLLNIDFSINYAQNLPYIIGVFGIAILVGIISGSYPAFYASAIRPIESLKDTSQSGQKSSLIKRILVVSQFSVSIILIISTIVIYSQLHFVKSKDLGYNKDNVLNIRLFDNKLSANYENIKAELLKNPYILSASGNYFMTSGGNNTVRWEGMKEDDNLFMYWFYADADFLETFQIELLEGRNFREGSESDVKYAYLLNETAVKTLGWETAVGKQFELERGGSKMGRVTGVVKDFHFWSLRSRIGPMVICMGRSFRVISLRINPDNIPGTLGFIRNKIQEFSPTAPFEYSFLDTDVIDDMYRLENITGHFFSHFALLAVFIACLGLLGLTSYSIIQKTREIGIRKVLGATVSNIVILLSKQFIRLVLIANIIAWPIAYFAMRQWLQNFAYRIGIGLWVFLLASVLVFVIALATISFQAVKAALSNPVDSLRYE
ncbi:MAG: ABC transporter permease [Candidatus Aminicenantes bacterium]|nr:ABC transporter permease [Candidatus Aminicenantes bacterium]MDH5705417.1 ABC transporter permease [Candidatus Aminicenantes bacterium]